MQQKKLQTTDFESSMADALKSASEKGGIFGIFGALHVPGLIKILEQHNQYAVGINCTAGIVIKYSDPLDYERNQQLESLYRVNLLSSQQPHPSQSILMIMKASLKSQFHQGEITEAEYSEKTHTISLQQKHVRSQLSKLLNKSR